MKKIAILAAFLSFLGPNLVLADQVVSASFKGLNANESSVIIDPSFAQDLLNVDVTPGSKSFKKRPGYGVYKSLGTGQPLHGGFHAFNSSGQDYQLWGSSTSLYSVVADGTPTQIISSSTLSATWDCTDSQGNSYCVNSSRDAYIRTDGTTMAWYTSPLGTMVESTPDRVVVAGVSGSPNTLYVSQSNTFTNFVTGVNPTDAFTEVIASPGSKLTHIRWGCGKLLWWKDQSMGYFDFDDQFTAEVKTVSNTIGTIDNTSAADPGGNVWFRGQEGHTWKYDCSILTKESIDITPFAISAGRRTFNSWSQTDASDFNAGSGVWIDTATVLGQVTLTGDSDTFSTLSGWSQSGIWTAASNTAIPSYSITTYRTLIKRTPAVNISSTSVFSEVLVKQGIGPIAGVGLMTVSSTGYVARFSDSGSGVIAIFNKVSSVGSPTTSISATAINAPTYDGLSYHVLDFEFRQATGGLFAYYDGILVSSATDTSFTNLSKQLIITVSVFASTDVATFQAPHVTSSTGTFRSAVHNAPNLTSWGSLSVNDSDNTHTFYMRSSTFSFTAASATPAWAVQSDGSFVVLSTGTYFQFRDDFSVTSGSQTPTLYDFTVSWTEGAVSDQSVMIYFDNAIWESVTYGPGQFTNNYIFKYDLINEGWTLYDFGAGGLLNYNNTLYFGDTDEDNIFSFGNSASDNGDPITAFWKSKDYSGADPFLQTQLTNIDTFARKNQGTALSVTYTMDTSTSTAYSMNLTNNTQNIIQSRKLLPSGKLGQVFNIRYGDDSTTSQWELLGYRIGFVSQPYRPTTQ